MKIILIKSLVLLLACQQLSLTAPAQTPSDTFDLPAGRVKEPYEVNIEQVLRQTFSLELKSTTDTPAFQWSLAGGAMPPGLKISPDGTIAGTPTAGREKPYVVILRAADARMPKASFLDLRFAIQIERPGIRLASLNPPSLVPVGLQPDPPSAECVGINQKIERMKRERSSRALSASRTYPVWPTALSDQCVNSVRDPNIPTGAHGITIDARDGHVKGLRRFETSEKVAGVLDHKNPYLYKYKYTSTRRSVSESAIAGFLPSLGGIVAGVATPPAAEKKEEPKAPSPAAPLGVSPLKTSKLNLPEAWKQDPCRESRQQLEALYSKMECTTEYASQIGEDLRRLKNDVNVLKEVYDAGKKSLQKADQPRKALYCASIQFLEIVNGDAYQPRITEVSDHLEDLQALAAGFASAIKDLANRFPDCVTARDMVKVSTYSEQLSATVKKNQEVVDQSKKVLTGVNEARGSVAGVLNNSESFVKVYEEKPFEGSAEAEIGVEITPWSKDTETPKPIQAAFNVGHAPFFSLSGGMVFSTLRKLEYERVQGFVLDRQGNQVLENGEPKLGPVVGLKEGSRTRISPLVLLHGRLPWGSASGFLNAVHASLGITAKNDNKGTDVEFLLGPSFSFLENNIFLTVGGYAGRQQRLEGKFFEGQAAPATLGELPIRKDYRWSLGISLSYRVPVNTEKKK